MLKWTRTRYLNTKITVCMDMVKFIFTQSEFIFNIPSLSVKTCDFRLWHINFEFTLWPVQELILLRLCWKPFGDNVEINTKSSAYNRYTIYFSSREGGWLSISCRSGMISLMKRLNSNGLRISPSCAAPSHLRVPRNCAPSLCPSFIMHQPGLSFLLHQYTGAIRQEQLYIIYRILVLVRSYAKEGCIGQFKSALLSQLGNIVVLTHTCTASLLWNPCMLCRHSFFTGPNVPIVFTVV